MFTYILPTIFKSNRLEKQLIKVLESDLIESVILIIDSDKDLLNTNHSKLIKIIPTDRQFCNGGWNLGARISITNHIILATDDIEYDTSIFSIIKEKLDSDNNIGVIGCEEENLKNEIINISKEDIELKEVYMRPYCFGQLMFMKREDFILIPDGIKHWFGDDLLFYYNKIKGKHNYSISGKFWMRSNISESSGGKSTLARIESDKMWWHQNAQNFLNSLV